MDSGCYGALCAFDLTALQPGTAYTLYLAAEDGLGNLQRQLASVAFTTQPQTQPPAAAISVSTRGFVDP